MSVTVGRRAWLTLLVTSTAVFMVSIEITIIALALPEIRSAFPGASESTLSWVISAYNIGVASLLLVSGWFSDRYGWRRFFIAGLLVFAVGSLLAGLAPNVTVLIMARVVQAMGGALQYPAGLALVLSAFPPGRQQMAIGIWGGVGGLAAALGPSLGALLVDAFGWRAIFLVNVPVALLGALGCLRWLAPDRASDTTDRVDLISVPLASIGVGAMILGLVQGSDWGWTSPALLGSFVLGATLIAVFWHRSRNHPAPLLDLALFQLPSFSLGNLGTVFFSLAFFSWLVVLPTFLQDVWGWSVLKTGFAIAPSPLAAFLLSGPAGRLADRIGNRPILMVGSLAGVTGSILHIVFLDTSPGYVSGILVPGQFIGIAAGLGFAQLVGASMRDVEPVQYGMAGAGRTTIFQLATALAIALGFTLLGEPEGTEATLAAFRRVFTLGVVCYGLQFMVFARLYPRAHAGRR